MTSKRHVVLMEPTGQPTQPTQRDESTPEAKDDLRSNATMENGHRPPLELWKVRKVKEVCPRKRYKVCLLVIRHFNGYA